MGQQIGLGIEKQPGNSREAHFERVDDLTELLPRSTLVGLFEDRPDRGGDHAASRARHEILSVASEMNPAALPARTEELLPDRLDQTCVVVGYD